MEPNRCAHCWCRCVLAPVCVVRVGVVMVGGVHGAAGPGGHMDGGDRPRRPAAAGGGGPGSGDHVAGMAARFAPAYGYIPYGFARAGPGATMYGPPGAHFMPLPLASPEYYAVASPSVCLRLRGRVRLSRRVWVAVAAARPARLRPTRLGCDPKRCVPDLGSMA